MRAPGDSNSLADLEVYFARKADSMHIWAILAFLVAGVAAALLRQWLVVLLALAVCLGLVPAVFELTS